MKHIFKLMVNKLLFYYYYYFNVLLFLKFSFSCCWCYVKTDIEPVSKYVFIIYSLIIIIITIIIIIIIKQFLCDHLTGKIPHKNKLSKNNPV